MLALNSDWNGESKNIQELEATLRELVEAGMTHIHWCHQWSGDYLYSTYEMIQIRQWLDRYGLKAKGVHATEGHWMDEELDTVDPNCKDFTSPNELNRLAGVELLKNRVDLAVALGTDLIVLHLHPPFHMFNEQPGSRERFYQAIFKTFDEMQSYCKVRGVRVCLENLQGIPNEHQIDQFDLMFNRYDKSYMGFCFDTGHALISKASAPLELPERYWERMYFIHLSDNQGDYDQHALPFEGAFDWTGLAKWIAKSPYELPVTLEVSRNDENEPFLKKALASGARLEALVRSYR